MDFVMQNALEKTLVFVNRNKKGMGKAQWDEIIVQIYKIFFIRQVIGESKIFKLFMWLFAISEFYSSFCMM